jgi:chromosomal replication initiation ATPase DnaA
MMEEIEKIICAARKISPEELHVKTREEKVKEIRQIIMYFARKINPLMSWKDIAGYFLLDHATAMHSSKRISDFIEIYPKYRENMDNYEKLLYKLKLDFNPLIIKNEEFFQENDFYPNL